MNLRIYHCNLVIIKDKKKSKSRFITPPKKSKKKPYMLYYPENPGECDIVFRPSIEGLKEDEYSKGLLREFENINILNLLETENSPIKINFEYLCKKLGLNEKEVKKLFRKNHEMRLLPGLTINYDHAQWLKHSIEKGCLLVTICIEKYDYEKEDILPNAVYKEIKEIRDHIVGKGVLNKVFLMPDAHLTEKENLGKRWLKNIDMMGKIAEKLKENGFEVQLNSFGYTKDLKLAIDGHHLGYVFRHL